MPQTSTRPPHAAAPTESAPTKGLNLGPAQVTGSALAAGTSAYAASFLGVTGTLVGAVIGSLVATVGGAVYAHSLRRAGHHLLPSANTTAMTMPTRSAAATEPMSVMPAMPRPGRTSTLFAGVLAGAVVALAAITGAEALLGHPLSGTSASTTSLGAAASEVIPQSAAQTPTPVPSSSGATTPSPSITPTSSPTSTGSPSPDPTATATPAPTTSPTPDPSPTVPASQPEPTPSAS